MLSGALRAQRFEAAAPKDKSAEAIMDVLVIDSAEKASEN
jgi:hypothetical protein